jgi:feruloyl esterase
MLRTLIAYIFLLQIVVAKDSHPAKPSPSPSPSPACSSLSGLSLQNAAGVVTLATSIAAGSNFTGTGAEPSYDVPQINLPALCRVAFTVQTSGNSSAVAEIWMPLPSTWNGRFLAVGNGGFAGGVNYPDIVWGMRKGFAAMSTNTGHNGGQLDPSPFLSRPETMIDWGHRALHLTTVAAKEIVAAYYGSSAKKNYYAGCSTGGRQGLNAAQRYPADYDGVLASSAIAWQTHTAEWQTYVALQQFPNNRSSFIPASMWPTIHTAVLNQCDLIDGVRDGIIMDPSKCFFHPEVLLCGKPNTNASSCLNGDQITNLKRMYAPWLADDGNLVNPGISPSGELSFSIIMNGLTPTFGPSFMQYMVFNDTTWPWQTQNVSDVAVADSVNPGGCNAYNPDMRPFQDRGGKVLQYHGYADPLVPSLNAPALYDFVNSFYESVGQAGTIEEFYRLFMVPGMGHCSGGAGAWAVDGASQGSQPGGVGSEYSMLLSLVDWVEGTGKAPEMVVGTKFVNDVPSEGIQFQRPVCRWPTVAEFQGGDVDAAKNWACPGIGVY